MGKWKVNDKVVVNTTPDTQIYTIAEINDKDHTAHLVYPAEAHGIVTGGYFPLDCLYAPSKQQLANYIEIEESLPGVYCADYGKAITESEYSKGCCSACDGAVADEADLIA